MHKMGSSIKDVHIERERVMSKEDKSGHGEGVHRIRGFGEDALYKSTFFA